MLTLGTDATVGKEGKTICSQSESNNNAHEFRPRRVRMATGGSASLMIKFMLQRCCQSTTTLYAQNHARIFLFARRRDFLRTASMFERFFGATTEKCQQKERKKCKPITPRAHQTTIND